MDGNLHLICPGRVLPDSWGNEVGFNFQLFWRNLSIIRWASYKIHSTLGDWAEGLLGGWRVFPPQGEPLIKLIWFMTQGQLNLDLTDFFFIEWLAF